MPIITVDLTQSELEDIRYLLSAGLRGCSGSVGRLEVARRKWLEAADRATQPKPAAWAILREERGRVAVRCGEVLGISEDHAGITRLFLRDGSNYSVGMPFRAVFRAITGKEISEP